MLRIYIYIIDRFLTSCVELCINKTDCSVSEKSVRERRSVSKIISLIFSFFFFEFIIRKELNFFLSSAWKSAFTDPLVSL